MSVSYLQNIYTDEARKAETVRLSAVIYICIYLKRFVVEAKAYNAVNRIKDIL